MCLGTYKNTYKKSGAELSSAPNKRRKPQGRRLCPVVSFMPLSRRYPPLSLPLVVAPRVWSSLVAPHAVVVVSRVSWPLALSWSLARGHGPYLASLGHMHGRWGIRIFVGPSVSSSLARVVVPRACRPSALPGIVGPSGFCAPCGPPISPLCSSLLYPPVEQI